MNRLPGEVFSVADVREIDRRAIEDEGIDGYTLMCRAGEAALLACRRRWPELRRWTIFCGAGNNAGDGYVLGRLAKAQQINVDLVALSAPEKLSGDAAKARDDFLAVSGRINAWRGTVPGDAGLLVDAILGSGLDRPLQGDFLAAVHAINAAGLPVVALDIPTGLHGDSGASLGSTVQADLTVTFVGLKPGLLLGDGLAAAGAVEFSGLAIPERCRAGLEPVLHRLSHVDLASWLPRRPRNSNKGEFGHVVVVGGHAGMPGAAILCGMAALRSGAGKVTVATDASHAAMLVAAHPELMVRGVGAPAELAPLLDSANVVAVGPGLGQGEWSRELLAAVVRAGKPSVWDADALNLLAAGRVTAEPDERRVITPHPGEAARLLSCATSDVQRDRLAAVRALQRRFGGIAVLKGAGSLVFGGKEPASICTAGNPGMASAGMGDVLTGAVAAMLAQGLGPFPAACAAVACHALAGDLAATRGERGLVASDLFEHLRACVNPLQVAGE